MDKLTGLDASFLFSEEPRTPMHVGGVQFYLPADGKFDFEHMRETIRARLHLSKVFRRRLVHAPMDVGRPRWIEDPDFDLDFHVRHDGLPAPGGPDELRAYVSRFFSIPLDPERPLWALTFVDGLGDIDGCPPGCFALVYKVHHSAVDGMATLDMLNALADPPADAPEPDASADTWHPDKVPGKLGMLWQSYLGALREPAETVRAVSDLVVGGARVGREILSGEHQRPAARLTAPKTPFNASVSANRILGATMFPLDQIRHIRKKVRGSTVNDVVLSLCAGALRRYLSEIGELPDESLVGMVPIAVRDDVDEGGNRVSAMTLSLETTESDSLRRLRLIHEHTVDSKAYSQALGARTLTDSAEAVPFGLGVVAARLYTRLHVADYLRPFFNIILTDVPGPREKKYLGGAEMQSTYGMAPVMDGLGAIIVITSYVDKLYVSIYACRDLLPDVSLFLDGLKTEYQELLRSIDDLPGKESHAESSRQ